MKKIYTVSWSDGYESSEVIAFKTEVEANLYCDYINRECELYNSLDDLTEETLDTIYDMCLMDVEDCHYYTSSMDYIDI